MPQSESYRAEAAGPAGDLQCQHSWPPTLLWLSCVLAQFATLCWPCRAKSCPPNSAPAALPVTHCSTAAGARRGRGSGGRRQQQRRGARIIWPARACDHRGSVRGPSLPGSSGGSRGEWLIQHGPCWRAGGGGRRRRRRFWRAAGRRGQRLGGGVGRGGAQEEGGGAPAVQVRGLVG